MSKPRTTPTLSDVAQAAGVSTATVSRALNDPDKLTLATRDRVLQAIQALGYAPNFAASAMASRRTRTIGAVIPTMENAIFARGLQAFQETLHAAGYTLLVASSSYDPQVEAEQIRTLVARGADGLLLIGRDRAPLIEEFLAARAVPVVQAWTLDPRQSSVGFDNRAAMAALARAVIARGHRRLAAISAPMATNDRARDRVAGIRDAMAEAGLLTGRLTCIETPYGIDQGAAAFRALMEASPAPTAILCGNDVLATGALLAAREMAIPVPGAVSVTGFDDIELARVAVPPLATVHVPHAEMGRRAAELMLSHLAGTPRPASIDIGTTLCLRASLGPPSTSR